jgi:hypothetical protein
MSRVKGAKNKEVRQPEIVDLEDKEKLAILADIMMEIIFEEGENAATDQ